MTSTERPLPTVATGAGAQRRRAERLLEAFGAQTVCANLDGVVVDVRSSMADLSGPQGLAANVVASDPRSFEQACGEAARMAHRQRWASDGYAMETQFAALLQTSHVPGRVR